MNSKIAILATILIGLTCLEYVNAQNHCQEQFDCLGCTTAWSCNWCATENKCVSGQFYGPSNGTVCGSWRWRQCKMPGLTFLILVSSGSGLGLILLITLICCCCCRCCKKAPKNEYISVNTIESPQEPLIRRSNTPVMDQRREELYEKYNIKRN